MNELKIFNNDEFGEIRIVMFGGEPWFVGKDVATALGYAKPENAISIHIDDEDKTSTLIQGSGSNYKSKAIIINESGLYSLVLSSKLPTARKFKRWVTSEVLPNIRKTGWYSTQPTGKELVALALIEAQKIIEQKDTEIARMRPKEIFADAVTASSDAILIGELAKIIKQNGKEIGQNRLFDWMRKNGYLISRNGSDYNMPTQKSMELKLFRIKERTINNPDGSVRITKTTLVTGKGQQYFINKLMNYGQEKLPVG